MVKLISKIISVSTLVTLLAISGSTQAASLGSCLVDSLDGKERKQLVRWIYFAIAAHPDMSSYSKITEEDRLNTDKYVGKLVSRLLIEDCAEVLKEAQKADPLALQKAFEMVGKVAMQDTMTDPSVLASISNYAKYTDLEKIEAILQAE